MGAGTVRCPAYLHGHMPSGESRRTSGPTLCEYTNELLKDEGQKSSSETPARTDWAPLPHETGESFTLGECVPTGSLASVSTDDRMDE